MSDSPVAAADAARLVAGFYEEYVRAFAAITGRAPRRFTARDWHGAQADARERILLYGQVVHQAVGGLRAALGSLPHLSAGSELKAAYGDWARCQQDVELAETFFNSVIRRVFGTAGVRPELEFAGSDLDRLSVAHTPVQRIRPPAESTAQLVAGILADLPVDGGWAGLAEDASLAARAIDDALGTPVGEADTVEVLPFLFFRNQGAYVVGRILRGGQAVPLVFALVHPPQGIRLDAVLLDRDDVSQVFSFTRSYFHADVQHPWSTVHFLRSIMPHKRLDELYTSIGFNRHGKTELFRALMQHLQQDGVRLEPAPGERGLVMAVFTLPTFDTVFKVIRDSFGHPKRTTRDAVMAKYNFIFVRDRVGRLADAQQFEHLELPRGCFTDELLEELLQLAGRRVRVHDDVVLIEHAYTERRVHPLNLYLRESEPELARRAVLEYGDCIKQLAAANIFPGDLLVKNFGVTRHGRVFFYDYDEVALLTELNFRRLPEARSPEDELAPDPWFHVDEHDVFPEEFRHFLGLPGGLGQLFEEAHGDLFDVAFWQEMQQRQRNGDVVDFSPYRQELRLRPDAGPARQAGPRPRREHRSALPDSARAEDWLSSSAGAARTHGRQEMNQEQFDKVRAGDGFIAALDQSGGSTPKALKLYGVGEDAYANETEMYDRIHEMRTRIVTSPAFDDRILGAILFENTMDREIEGKGTADYLWSVKRVVPFLKVDKGLAAEANGVQLMKPMPDLDNLLGRARAKGIFGTKMRSVIKRADEAGIDAIVAQQFEYGHQILRAGLVPILEPEVDIHSPDKAEAETLLKQKLLAGLKSIPEGLVVIFKLTLPEVDGFYQELVDHPKVLKVVALSGGYSRDEANEKLARNPGVVASFSRALTEGLRADQSDEAYNAALDEAIESIYAASVA